MPISNDVVGLKYKGKIETVDPKHNVKIEFTIISKEGSFSDTVQANYNIRGQGSSALRYAQQQTAQFVGNWGNNTATRIAKNELTVAYEGVSPKTTSFDMVFEVSRTESAQSIIDKISHLQALCYPTARIGANPPLCRLVILNLYDFECWVQDVNVTWNNVWNTEEGLPRGAIVTTTVLQYAYPTFEEVKRGAGFLQARRNYDGSTLRLESANEESN